MNTTPRDVTNGPNELTIDDIAKEKRQAAFSQIIGRVKQNREAIETLGLGPEQIKLEDKEDEGGDVSGISALVFGDKDKQ